MYRIHQRGKILIKLVRIKRDLANRYMDIGGLIEAELDATCFCLPDGAGQVISTDNRASLRIRHQTARTQHAPQATDPTHRIGCRDRHIEIQHAAFDLFQGLIVIGNQVCARSTRRGGSFNFERPQIDMSGPLNRSRTLLYRFNAAYDHSDTFRDFNERERVFIAPVVTWIAGTNTTITIDGEAMRGTSLIDRGLIAVGSGIAPVPLSRYLGDPAIPYKYRQGRAGAHLLGGLVGEGDRQHLLGLGVSAADEIGDPAGDDAGLAGPGAGLDEFRIVRLPRQRRHEGSRLGHLVPRHEALEGRHLSRAGLEICMVADAVGDGLVELVDGAAPDPVVVVEVGITGKALRAGAVALRAIDPVGRRAAGDIVLEKLRGIGVAKGHPLSEKLKMTLDEAHLNSGLFDDAASMKWSKLLTNLTANPTSAILDLTASEVFANKDLFQLEIEMLRECLAVMEAQKLEVVDLPGTPVRALAFATALPSWLSKPLLSRAAGAGRGAKMPSFHIDLHSGRGKSEVEYLHGAVVRAGEKFGVPTPVNKVLTETLVALTNKEIPLDEFARQPEKLLLKVSRAGLKPAGITSG